MSTYLRVLDEIGFAVVAGELGEGAVETVERIERRTGASRSVVREAVRVLVNLGLLRASRKIGLTVQPRASWNVLDPQVIRWRLAGPDHDDQLAELSDLRLAVEPEAARLAAQRRSEADAAGLLSAAEELRAAATDTAEAFLTADRRLHSVLLRCSGNPMFVRLQLVIEEALRERAVGTTAVLTPDPGAVELHAELARAVAASRPEPAATAMREIVTGWTSHSSHPS